MSLHVSSCFYYIALDITDWHHSELKRIHDTTTARYDTSCCQAALHDPVSLRKRLRSSSLSSFFLLRSLMAPTQEEVRKRTAVDEWLQLRNGGEYEVMSCYVAEEALNINSTVDGIWWDMMGYIWIYDDIWNIMEYSGIYWDTLGYIGILWDIMG